MFSQGSKPVLASVCYLQWKIDVRNREKKWKHDRINNEKYKCVSWTAQIFFMKPWEKMKAGQIFYNHHIGLHRILFVNNVDSFQYNYSYT